MLKPIPQDQLQLAIDEESVDFDPHRNFPPQDGIIGQPRAVKALQFGLEIQDVGFNIYVSGPRGIGKMTAVESFLRNMAQTKPAPEDWCYVHNFDDSYQPKAIRLPAGRGREFQHDMRRFSDFLRREIPKLFESDEYTSKREEILRVLNQQRGHIVKSIAARASQQGFILQTTAMGVLVIPAKDGHPMSEEEWNNQPEELRHERVEKRDVLQEELQEAMKTTRDTERSTNQTLRSLDRQTVIFHIAGTIDEFREKYDMLDDVWAFLHAVQADLLENLDVFRSDDGSNQDVRDGVLSNYSVNLLVDNAKLKGMPVIVELHPTYTNLFGRVEKEMEGGGVYTDYSMIKAGAFHRANGGFLVLPAEGLLSNVMSWDGLKRALKTRSIQIEEPGESMGLSVSKTLRPVPIPLDIKILIVGPPMMYYLLHSLDDDFPELFKVKADFDVSMDRTPENTEEFLTFLSTLCGKESLLPLDRGAAARMLEYACRLADDREKISTHFGALADVIRESHFWATGQESTVIRRQHIQKTLDEKKYRSNLYEEHFREYVRKNVLIIDVAGQAIGQVNGLSVLRLGEYEFGKPSRITATVSPGGEGIVDIERQVDLGGPIHSKGVLILSGYLSRIFAVHRPLTLSARLVFEQSYEGVEGDSASSTELYALLSALSGLPIDQGIAVTGSVNQNGEIQAIGGVNEKIEGFFDVCRIKGWTGRQGALIPASNVRNLVLRHDILDAVSEGKFRLWSVSTIEEGIEVLTGRQAGPRGRDGRFRKNSVFDLVDRRLEEFAASLKQYGRPTPRKSGKKK